MLMLITAGGLSAQQYGSFKDPRDGRVYKTVKIGDQVWMAENLSAIKFSNGDIIPEAKTEAEWILAGKNKQPAWCYYNFDANYEATYGRLYNWYAVNDFRGLEPSGWAIPKEKDWIGLKVLLEGGDINWRELILSNANKVNDKVSIDLLGAGWKMKNASGWKKWRLRDEEVKYESSRKTEVWSTGGSNESGFSALPGGQIGNGGIAAFNDDTTSRYFYNLGDVGYWWTRSEDSETTEYYAKFSSLSYSSSFFQTGLLSKKDFGYSIRCFRKFNYIQSSKFNDSTIVTIAFVNQNNFDSETPFFKDSLALIRRTITIAHKRKYFFYGLYNRELKSLLSPDYTSIGDFKNGVAKIIRTFPDGSNKIGFINKTGKVVIPVIHRDNNYSQFSDGLCPIEGANGFFGFINVKGELVLPYKYLLVGGKGFSSGYSQVKLATTSEIYLIDKLGKIIDKRSDNPSSSFKFTSGDVKLDPNNRHICPDCNGAKYFKGCEKCDDKGVLHCSPCSGTGENISSKQVNCMGQEIIGIVYCSRCRGGCNFPEYKYFKNGIKCLKCRGQGLVYCTECQGKPKLHHYKCESCEGIGYKKFIVCIYCKGELPKKNELSPEMNAFIFGKCNMCKGSGKLSRPLSY
jgi:uncharacterized protein (TIGR02145 family)